MRRLSSYSLVAVSVQASSIAHIGFATFLRLPQLHTNDGRFPSGLLCRLRAWKKSAVRQTDKARSAGHPSATIRKSEWRAMLRSCAAAKAVPGRLVWDDLVRWKRKNSSSDKEIDFSRCPECALISEKQVWSFGANPVARFIWQVYLRLSPTKSRANIV